MKELRVEQRDNLLAPPLHGELPYRMNRWLPVAPIAGLIGTMIAILIYPPLDRKVLFRDGFHYFLSLPVPDFLHSEKAETWR